MIITSDRDVCIADYSIKSLTLIKDINFRLIIYSNYVPKNLKEIYFPKWKKISYVSIIENNYQDSLKFIKDPNILYNEGNFDNPSTIWDKELKKIDSELIGIIDSDCEIFSQKIVLDMLNVLNDNKKCLGVSANYYKGGLSNTNLRTEELTNYKLYEEPVYNIYLIIYRKENIDFNISTQVKWKINDSNKTVKYWDAHSFFQHAHIKKGFFLKSFSKEKYRNHIIHYGRFAKNIKLNESNIKLYRQLRILAHKGIFNLKITRYLFLIFRLILFFLYDHSRTKFNLDS